MFLLTYLLAGISASQTFDILERTKGLSAELIFSAALTCILLVFGSHQLVEGSGWLPIDPLLTAALIYSLILLAVFRIEA